MCYPSSHWYVAVICHAGSFEATSSISSRSASNTSLLDSSVVMTESSDDVISGVLEEDSSMANPSPVITQVTIENFELYYIKGGNCKYLYKQLEYCGLVH